MGIIKYSNKYNLAVRIIAVPFILGLLFITHNCFVIKRTINFIRFGGEYVPYEHDDFKAIQDIYKEIKAKNKP